ncbi:GNAT family N-acetyltransferase [Lactobacillus sp. ESL0731]|uniref:GNAT family N-acetyltransferase n=1 Tax=unclassified Lactobacillus TaxID=2620435 RepID=UPI0023F91440|nr:MULTISPECIES: GNAT family N-acetyltransferase [unclassified Lactobacillus]WEV51233.1 GNAT family N-acetyltransferase [Lactobacillus sp. ESL0700]WEV62363.1 GNAT family N-acetyltransferase [Lactobacillus sp. ESL0731]
MTYEIMQLTQKNAVEIADQWHYDGQYAFYDMTADPEDYEELVTPKLRQNNYYQVLNDNKLIGFFVIESADKNQGVYELGLGMKPNLTGQGKGQEFLRQILAFVTSKFAITELILDVAEFNVRAQKVYQHLGFIPVKKHQQETNNSVYPFIEMRRKFN